MSRFIFRLLNKWEESVLFVFMLLMLVILTIQVFTRYVLSFSFSWAEQLARFGFVWLTMSGVSLAAKKGMHLKVDFLPQILPPKIGRIICYLSDFFVVTFGFYMGWLILKTVIMQVKLEQYFSSIPWLPVWTMYIAGVIGMFGLSLRTLQRIIIEAKTRKTAIQEEER